MVFTVTFAIPLKPRISEKKYFPLLQQTGLKCAESGVALYLAPNTGPNMGSAAREGPRCTSISEETHSFEGQMAMTVLC